MVWPLCCYLMASLLLLRATPLAVFKNDVQSLPIETNASVGSLGISVSLGGDDVLSGSLISAVFTMPDSTEDLFISSYSVD